MAKQPAARFNPARGTPPELVWLKPSDLHVDPAYQRGMQEKKSVALVARIARDWDWGLCQPLIVARRRSLTVQHFVVDGQHRLTAARHRRDITALPCVITEHDSVADEAASFVALNQNRKPLGRLDLFRASVASGDARSVAIMDALAAAGLELAPHSNAASWKPGQVGHVGGIEREWNRAGQAVAVKALDALGAGFRGQVLRQCGTLYRGIARVCQDEFKARGGFEGERFDRFVAMLRGHDHDEWVRLIGRYLAEQPDLFRAEAVEGLMCKFWRGRDAAEVVTAAIPATRPVGEPVLAERKGQGFGLGAGDWKGDEEWAWCEQCDQRRTRAQAGACVSRFCKLRGLA